MVIHSARFVKSSSTIDQCPAPTYPEYAFIGRSNVGKSSLINMLTGFNSLAKVSGTPGKTQLINHFEINEAWYLVDLPGYGYAKVAKTRRQVFSEMITNYIKNRESLTCLFVLIDSRLEPQKIDSEFISWVGSSGIPLAIIFTKCDKLGSIKLTESIVHYKKHLLESWEQLPPIFITSAAERTGRTEILKYIKEINATLAESDI